MGYWRDDLFTTLTSGAPGQWVMAWPIVAIDLKIFNKGGAAANEYAARLVNVVPDRSDIYATSGQFVDSVYGDVIENAGPVLGADLAAWSKRIDRAALLFDDAKRASLESPMGDYRMVSLSPVDWFKRTSYNTFDSNLDVGSGPSVTVDSTSTFVSITRSWFDSGLLSLDNWHVSGRTAGSISSGKIGEGIMSAVISNLLVVGSVHLSNPNENVDEWPVSSPGIFGFGLSPVPRCPSVD